MKTAPHELVPLDPTMPIMLPEGWGLKRVISGDDAFYPGRGAKWATAWQLAPNEVFWITYPGMPATTWHPYVFREAHKYGGVVLVATCVGPRLHGAGGCKSVVVKDFGIAKGAVVAVLWPPAQWLTSLLEAVLSNP